MDIAHLERLCEVMYNSSNAEDRKSAEAQLLTLQSSTQFLPQIMQIFDQSQSSYALLIAGTSLNGLVSNSWNKISVEQRLEIRIYVMNYVMARGPSLANFVMACLIKLIVRVTKLGWFDGPRHREIVDEASKLYNASLEHCPIALNMLAALVEEFNLMSTRADARSLTAQRKSAVSFRDSCLFSVVSIAQSTLAKLRSREWAQSGLTPASESKIAEQALKLLTLCLSFDFIGTNADESSDDVGTIQLPSGWRPVAHDPQLMATLFEFFGAGEPQTSSAAMRSLVLLSSVRRSLFASDADRARFLNQMMRGIRDILASQSGLQHEENYHEFCRLLGRLKSNYQLSELVNAEVYTEWLELAARFTAASFEQWQWSHNSIQYLLALWGRLVAAVPYVRPDSTAGANGVNAHMRLLEVSVLEVARKYVEAMVMSVQVVALAEGSVDDPLDDEGALKEQLERLPVICRFQYAPLARYVAQLLDATTLRYQELTESPATANATELAVVERQLAWLVYIVGAVVGGVSWNQLPLSDGEETLDASLSRRAFELASAVDYRSAKGHAASARLELALLYFFANFRRVYLWEQHAMPSHRAVGGLASAQIETSAAVTPKQKTFLRMFEHMALGDASAATNRVATKVANNLRYWPAHEEIIKTTLALFHEMATGFAPAKVMLQLEAVQFLIEGRASPETGLPFLARARPRHRTTLHATLARLVLLVADEPQQAFETFLEPLLATLRDLDALSKTQPQVLASERCRAALVGALRDLRGVAQACANKRAYAMLFEALYPTHLTVIARCAEVFAHDAEVSTALLRFVREFVHNRGQRIQFERSSPNGILLFREASRVVVNYGTAHLRARSPSIDGKSDAAIDSPSLTDAQDAGHQRATGDEYKRVHKGVVLALSLLTCALDGNYVNFGVFALYEDQALSNALEIATRLSCAASLEELFAYPKLAAAFFGFYEVVFREHLAFLLCKDTETFALVLRAIHDALEQPPLAALAASALDHLATFAFTKRTRRELSAVRALEQHLALRPQLLRKLLSTLLNQLLFGPPSNHWVLTRPVLSLMLIDEQGFVDYKDELIQSQTSADHRQRLQDAFATLLNNVHRNLEPANRDHFTQALSAFRLEVRQFLVC